MTWGLHSSIFRLWALSLLKFKCSLHIASMPVFTVLFIVDPYPLCRHLFNDPLRSLSLLCLVLSHPQASATPVTTPAATPPPPPPLTTSLHSRLFPSPSLSHSSHSNPSPQSSLPPSSWPAPPGATRAATWWRLQLETLTKSPCFTRTSCRNQKVLPNSPSYITVTSARSAVLALR